MGINSKFWSFLIVIGAILVVFFSSIFGAVNIDYIQMLHALTKLMNHENMNLQERIFIELRLSRVLMTFATGSILSLGGAMMQSLFRNPIVEPGLIGTSSGAAFGASVFIVFGASWNLTAYAFALPICAFLGALLASILVFMFSYQKTGMNVMGILLVGVALNALFSSGIGFLSYISRDPQARSITFWSLGSLSGANWQNTGIVWLVLLMSFIGVIPLNKQLQLFVLGEENATYLGVNVPKLRMKVMLINVLMISVATAFVGVISFVGLIIPHVHRLIFGNSGKFSLLITALFGGIFLCLADLLARMIFAPAELPIGVVTSLIGVPIFIILLKRSHVL
jgi:iron complex transport system permease protein